MSKCDGTDGDGCGSTGPELSDGDCSWCGHLVADHQYGDGSRRCLNIPCVCIGVMPPRKPAPDLDHTDRLLTVAAAAIRKRLTEGLSRHPPGEWATVDHAVHVRHLYGHAEGAWTTTSLIDRRTHLRAILARAAMALAVLDGEK